MRALVFLAMYVAIAAYGAFIVLLNRAEDLARCLAEAEQKNAVMSRGAEEAYRLAMLDNSGPKN